MKPSYDAGHFDGLYQTQVGQELWKFLNEHENVVRMETATYLERPAIEAIAPQLKARFPEGSSDPRFKQMAGSMVRQILESNGYRLHRQNVPIPAQRRAVFSSGSRYQKVTTNGN